MEGSPLYCRIVVLVVMAASFLHAGDVRVFLVNGGRLYATHRGCSVVADGRNGATFDVDCGGKVYTYSTNMFGFVQEADGPVRR